MDYLDWMERKETEVLLVKLVLRVMLEMYQKKDKRESLDHQVRLNLKTNG
jgi:hypothetical protein